MQFDRNLLGDETVSGLCGDFDKNPENDLKLWSTGGITTVPTEFGNQWKLDRTVCIDSTRLKSSNSDCLFSVRMFHQWSMIVLLLQLFWKHAVH